MAYGLDVDAVYYTDHNLVDLGVFDTYEINIDLAKEKDFEIKTADYNAPIDGYWYIPETEYGGRIRAKGTNSDEEEATYEGSTWRGVLAEHKVEVDDDEDVRLVQGNIDELTNDLLQEYGLEDLFICDPPYVESGIDTSVDMFEVARGMSLYDVIWGSARSINLTFVFSFHNKQVHLLPILSEDYTDYMVYSSIGALDFQMEESWKAVNHYIVTSISDDNEKRTIHLFSDGNALMPYATVADPVKDSDYILDKSQQVLFGTDEVTEYSEVSAGTTENYVLVNTAPKNWKRKFGNYFYKVVENEQAKFMQYEATEVITYHLLTSKPSDWNNHYSKYYDRQVEDTRYVYNTVSGNSQLDVSNKKRVKKRPRDWKTDYGSYYYAYESGTGTEYDQYSGISKNKYIKLTKKPSDWSTNYSSYYRKVITKTKTIKGEKRKYYVDVKKNEKGKYVTVEGVKSGNHEVAPSFKAHTYYKQESYDVPPKFLKNNCYMIPNEEIAPTWTANTYYRQKIAYKAPKFVKGDVYKIEYDHYKTMVDGALNYMLEQVRTKSQKVTMDDFIVNIGDTVGGRDEFTGETIVAEIDNIEAKIDNGMLEVQYVIGG